MSVSCSEINLQGGGAHAHHRTVPQRSLQIRMKVGRCGGDCPLIVRRQGPAQILDGRQRREEYRIAVQVQGDGLAGPYLATDLAMIAHVGVRPSARGPGAFKRRRGRTMAGPWPSEHGRRP